MGFLWSQLSILLELGSGCSWVVDTWVVGGHLYHHYDFFWAGGAGALLVLGTVFHICGLAYPSAMAWDALRMFRGTFFTISEYMAHKDEDENYADTANTLWLINAWIWFGGAILWIIDPKAFKFGNWAKALVFLMSLGTGGLAAVRGGALAPALNAFLHALFAGKLFVPALVLASGLTGASAVRAGVCTRLSCSCSTARRFARLAPTTAACWRIGSSITAARSGRRRRLSPDLRHRLRPRPPQCSRYHMARRPTIRSN